MNKQVQQLKQLIEESNNIVFFGGAGVSTESGIPDFRSTNGLYNQKYDYPPEEILSHRFFFQHTEDFFKFYREKMNPLSYLPNVTHMKLAELEKNGKLQSIITQNIDGLHQKAGSYNVRELHGSVLNNYCIKCGKNYPAEFIFNSNVTPKCTDCNNIIKPDVVLYGESLNKYVLGLARLEIAEADLFIVAGSSLRVSPANTLVDYFTGKNLVIINKEPTPYDYKATLLIRQNLGDVFSEL